MFDLGTTIAGVRLDPCIMNASGPLCTTFAELTDLARSAAGAVVTKSMTLAPRQGNPEPRYADLPQGSINAMGLPNLGVDAYCEFSELLRALGKPVIASVAAVEPGELVPAIARAASAAFDLIEANLSCPNLPGHPIIAYDVDALARLLREARAVCHRPLGVKLPPYFDRVHQERVAALLRETGIDFITVINSVPNALVIDLEHERPLIHPKGGFGGLGGAFVKPIALANVRAFYELLDGAIPIIGVGGVYTGRDIAEFLLAGASAVQVGTAYRQEGPAIFARLAQELASVLAEKRCAAAADLVGRLQPLPAAAETLPA